jgi:putative ABC transport system substrate-binding protein
MKRNLMQRREFITLLGGAAAWPLTARAQQSGRLRRLGILMTNSESDPEGQARIGAFRQGLQELGWTEGRNLLFEYRWTGGSMDRIRSGAAELVALAPDILLANGAAALVALQQATRSIPIVFALAVDPVTTANLASMARPGGNVTGFSFIDLPMIGKWMDLLKQVSPGIKRAALVFDPRATPFYQAYVRSFETAPHPSGMELKAAPHQDMAELESLIAAFAREPGGSLILPPGPLTIVHSQTIARWAEQHKLPAISVYRRFARDGGLMSYGPDTADIFRRSASYVDRILKGANPAELPVQAPVKFEFAINLKAAKAIGIDVPPMLLALADEAIE